MFHKHRHFNHEIPSLYLVQVLQPQQPIASVETRNTMTDSQKTFPSPTSAVSFKESTKVHKKSSLLAQQHHAHLEFMQSIFE